MATQKAKRKPKQQRKARAKNKPDSVMYGNQFWRIRSKHGRDKLFATAKLLLDACCEYFQWCDENPFLEEIAFSTKDGIKKSTLNKMRPYTLQGLTSYLDCNTVYFNHFEEDLKGKEDETSKDFSKVITCVREIIYNQKFSGAASGFFNSNIIARDLGLADVQKQAVTVDSEKKIELKIDGENIDLSK